MAPEVTRCDLVRSARDVAKYGQICSGQRQTGTAGQCALLKGADATRDRTYFRLHLTSLLTNEGRHARKAGLYNAEEALREAAEDIAKTYGDDAPPKITWPDFLRCLVSETGDKIMQANGRYFNREYLYYLGYEPRPLIGGSFLLGTLPRALTGLVPLQADVFMNADLTALFGIVLLVVVAAILVWRKRKYDEERKHPGAEEKGKMKGKGKKGDALSKKSTRELQVEAYNYYLDAGKPGKAAAFWRDQNIKEPPPSRPARR